MTYYQFRPQDVVHVTESTDENESTLCGLAHQGEVSDMGDTLCGVLPKHLPTCQRCRASVTAKVFDDRGFDASTLSIGDVVEYWKHDDPTDSNSSLCVREEGVITKVPPWDPSYENDGEMITGAYNVKVGKSMSTRVRFNRIWRVNHKEPTAVLDETTVNTVLGEHNV